MRCTLFSFQSSLISLDFTDKINEITLGTSNITLTFKLYFCIKIFIPQNFFLNVIKIYLKVIKFKSIMKVVEFKGECCDYTEKCGFHMYDIVSVDFTS